MGLAISAQVAAWFRRNETIRHNRSALKTRFFKQYEWVVLSPLLRDSAQIVSLS